MLFINVRNIRRSVPALIGLLKIFSTNLDCFCIIMLCFVWNRRFSFLCPMVTILAHLATFLHNHGVFCMKSSIFFWCPMVTIPAHLEPCFLFCWKYYMFSYENWWGLYTLVVFGDCSSKLNRGYGISVKYIHNVEIAIMHAIVFCGHHMYAHTFQNTRIYIGFLV